MVYPKPPFQSPRRVLKYLARYTHRLAFSNRRLLRFDPGQGRVAFLCKDYRTGKRRTQTLGAAEFIRRFLLHVLPGGFMRIRHYGFLANCVRRKKLALCRGLLGQPADGPKDRSSPAEQQPQQCPACGKGVLCAIATLPPEAQPGQGPDYLRKLDSS